ncbi:hypothetical protein Back11_09380 [Paenibacillus baekrokdamisoli]|uniref:Uncharacterized protein n=1 Tax=Paenibacillus baekrokdamisoli TaxID=1712516 RepID=A0A3G9J4E4_9BACL|nr:hypothetical protein [Paenibacillus baekrokdamisoli]MBB3067215.1 HSP20 family molecular chaperone IbpA [Paenibacillus baekrokdamisoli]BBH19593.1 hypothetical protein Back11_09380 [Paenibacillus baekrokdamisoli]
MTSGLDDLEKWMEHKRLPKGADIFTQQDWIGDYVRKLVTKALPEAASVLGSFQAEIKETKRYIHVTYPLGEETDVKQIGLLVREDRLLISGLKGGESETIKLPKLVAIRSCMAEFDGATLHIKLRKRLPSKAEHEAVIRLI